MNLRASVPSWLVAAGLAALLALPLRAQVSRSAYDPAGNLASRAPAVTAPPQILRPPAPQIVEPGRAATFSVTLADPRGATFQWRFNGNPIAGATGDSLRVANVSSANEGPYTVTVTNAAGAATSDPAMLWIDSDGDGLPDTYEIANFGNLSRTALGDFDGDGVSNLDEFLQGTNPTDSASFRVRLRVAKAGSGAVTVSPLRDFYTAGDVVTLTAVPAAGYAFDQWSGDLATTASTTTLTLNASKSVTATFAAYAPVPNGLLAWWRGETDASDTVGGHHGAFYAGANPISPTTTPAGQVGGAFVFDGATHVRVPDAPELRPERYTVEMWLYPTVQNQGVQTFFTRGSSTGSDNSWPLYLSDGFVGFNYQSVEGALARVVDNSGRLPLNQWTHVAASFDGNTLRLYVNGGLRNAGGGSGALYYDPAPVPVTLGSGWANGASVNPFTGRLDEVCLYGRALSDAEVAAVFAAGRRGKTLQQPYLLTPARLPDAIVGVAYSNPFAAVIGPAPFRYELAAGALPPGLSLGSAGVLSGTPVQPGEYQFNVSARDAAGRTSQQAYLLTVGQRIAPPLGMIAWWRGEPDPNGLAKDQIGGHDGTFYRNGVVVPGVHGPGKVSQAFAFDSARHIRVPDDLTLRPAQVTGEAWVYQVVNGSYQTVMAKGFDNSDQDTWWIGTNQGYPLFFSKHQNTGTGLSGPSRLPLNAWSHLAFTFDGSTVTFYVNGVAVGSQGGLGPLVYDSTPTPLTIGSDWDFNSPRHVTYARLDEVTLYGRGLSGGEVAAIYAAGVGGKALSGPFLVDLGTAATGRAFTGSFSFPMGVAPVTYALLSGTLPPGFTLGSNGVLSGTSATRGDFTLTVRATDANGAFQDETATLRVLPAYYRPPGLISWYRGENNALDTIGGNHGTPVGGASYAPGKVGATFSLNGQDGRVQIPDAPTLRPAALAVETWINSRSPNPNAIEVYACKTVGTASSDTWALFLQYGSLRATVTTANGSATAVFPWLPTADRWYHVAMTYDPAASRLSLYLDGARVASQTATGALVYDAHPVVIGADIESESPAYFFNGRVDEPAIYNRALSDAEIASIYASDFAGKALPGFADYENLDGDGLPNVLEYTLGTDPTKAGGVPFTAGRIRNPDGSVQAIISFLRDPAKTDLTIVVESSGDLLDWVPIATSVNGQPFTGIATVTGEVAGSAPRVITVIDPFAEPAAGAGKGFLRVRVSR